MHNNNHLLYPLRPFLRPFNGWMLAADDTAACKFNGIVWHDDGISPAFRFKAAGIWLCPPLLVGVAICIKPAFNGSFMGLMETFDALSSRGFDVSERGTIGLPVSIVMRGGEPGNDDAPMMLGDKFVDWKDAWSWENSLNLGNFSWLTFARQTGDDVVTLESELVEL